MGLRLNGEGNYAPNNFSYFSNPLWIYSDSFSFFFKFQLCICVVEIDLNVFKNSNKKGDIYTC